MLGIKQNYQNAQIAFRAKQPNRKDIHKFIDMTNDLSADLKNKDRPIAEQRFLLRGKSVSSVMSLFNKLPKLFKKL